MFAPWSHICGNMIICNGGHVYTLKTILDQFLTLNTMVIVSRPVFNGNTLKMKKHDDKIPKTISIYFSYIQQQAECMDMTHTEKFVSQYSPSNLGVRVSSPANLEVW